MQRILVAVADMRHTLWREPFTPKAGIVALFMTLVGLCPATADPLTCKNLQARLSTKFSDDVALNTTPIAIKDSAFDTSLKIIDGSSIYDGSIECNGDDQSPSSVRILFRILDISLPSKGRDALAILTDVICTLTKSQNEDCEQVAMDSTNKAVHNGYDSLHLSAEGWSLSVNYFGDDISYEFRPGPITDSSTPELSPNR